MAVQLGALTIISLIEVGAHVNVSAKDHGTVNLTKMAETSAFRNTELTIRDAGEQGSTALEAVVKAGKGMVTLVF